MGLLAESVPLRLASWVPEWREDATCLPGVAAAIGRPGLLQAPAQALTGWLQTRLSQDGAEARVCVVGNAASLAGQGLGPCIDRHAVVCRFNQWWGGAALPADVGERVDVWVIAPDLRCEMPPVMPRWALVSGPDPRYQVQQWPLVRQLEDAGVPVLTVPLPVWRLLVRQLQAPPSAGLLLLGWLVDLFGPARLTVAGVGQGAAPGAYHLARPLARPGKRHAWQQEARLLARWRTAGLRDLSAADPDQIP